MIRKLKKEIRDYIDKRSSSLKMYRYKDRGIEYMLDRVVPTDANKLQLIASKHHWLMNNAPEEYVYGEMIDINNAIASNLRGHLKRYAQNYINNYDK
jgi:hypothetical protein|tara:strand:+ start:1674 stop:1964 length:291 start_codon:yes stop_codon:yes gene_type:complete